MNANENRRVPIGGMMVAAPAAVIGVGVAIHPLYGALAATVPLVLLRFVRGHLVLLQALVLSMFVESLALAGEFRVGRLLAVVVVVVLAARSLSHQWRPAAPPWWTWAPAAGLVLWAGASWFWTSHPGGWAFAMGQFGLAVAYFAAFALMVESPDDVRRLLQAFVVGAVVMAGVAVAQAATGGRAVGLQGDANLFALYQVAAVPAAMALARGAGAARWWSAALPPLGLSVVLSQSRGGLIALGVVLVAVVPRPAFWGGRRWRGAAATILLAAGATAGILAFPSVTDRFDPARLAEDRGSGRFDVWRVAWRSVEREPVLGIGGGSFKPESLELLASEPGVDLPANHHLFELDGIEVHSIYLEALVEYGPLGLVLLLGMLAAAARSARGAVRRFRRARWLEALPGMLLAFVVGAAFLSVLNSKLLWSLAGIGAALMTRREEHGPEA